MYVISLVKLKKNFWLFVRVLVVLVIVGLLLPRLVGLVSKSASPGTGWLKGNVASATSWVKSAWEKVTLGVEPFVQTLKDYYRGH